MFEELLITGREILRQRRVAEEASYAETMDGVQYELALALAKAQEAFLGLTVEPPAITYPADIERIPLVFKVRLKETHVEVRLKRDWSGNWDHEDQQPERRYFATASFAYRDSGVYPTGYKTTASLAEALALAEEAQSKYYHAVELFKAHQAGKEARELMKPESLADRLYDLLVEIIGAEAPVSE